MFFVEQYPFVAISVATFPVLFFPAQVMMDIPLTLQKFQIYRKPILFRVP